MRRDIFPEPRLLVAFTERLLKQAHAYWAQSQAAHTWHTVTLEVFDTHLHANDTYFLLYEHPIHVYLNRGYQTLGQPLKEWLAKHIELGGKVGLDIWILPEKQDWLIGCNHNGDISASIGTLF
jgi:hypothetical protein